MRLTKNEMEILCIFHAGTLAATIEALRGALSVPNQIHPRVADIESLLAKYDSMEAGTAICIAFDDVV